MSDRRPAKLLRKQEIDASLKTYSQRLNPRSRFKGAWLSRMAGLRGAVDFVTLPPGAESFAYHAHTVEEEWLYVVSGRAVALCDGVETELAAGDFLAFPAPSVPHLLKNPFAEPCAYLMGGDTAPMDVLDYPSLGKRYLLLRQPGQPSAFHSLGAPEQPFGPVNEE